MSRVKDLVHNITLRCKGFEAFWETERNWHSDQQGHISLHGAFSVLSEFLSAHYDTLTDVEQRKIWEWIQWQYSSNEPDRSEAVVTCLLENLAETEVENHSRAFMPQELIQWFDETGGRGQRKKRWFES